LADEDLKMLYAACLYSSDLAVSPVNVANQMSTALNAIRVSSIPLPVHSLTAAFSSHIGEQQCYYYVNKFYKMPCCCREDRAMRRCKFRYVSNFTTASCGFFTTARLSCWSLSAECRLHAVNNLSKTAKY